MDGLRRAWKRNLLAALLIGLVFAGGMAYYTYRLEADRYTAAACVYIKPDSADDGRIVPVDTLLADTRAMLRDPALLQSAEARMRPTSFSSDRLTASVSGEKGSRVIVLTVAGEDARACQRAANALGEAYCEYLIGLGAAADAEVSQKAALPDAPSAPNRPMKIALTFVVCFGAALIALLLFSARGTRVLAQSDLKRENLPVLGRIADFRGDLSRFFSKRRPTRQTLYAISGQSVVEDVRALSVSLRYAARGAQMRSLVVCSTLPDEGKSTLCVLLGSELAMQDQSVLLVDMDFYAPTLGKLLGRTGGADLIDLFGGKATIEQTLLETPLRGLYMIGNRHRGLSALQITSSAAFSAFLNHAYEQFDYVLFDTPPVSLYADALALGGMMDATLLAVGDNRVKRRELHASVEKLRQSGAKLLGAAFTYVKKKRERFYRDYEDGYAPPDQDE